MTYTRDFGSQFPNKILDLKTFKDVDSTVSSLVESIKKYQNEGKYKEAQSIIDANKSTLENYMLSSEYLNLLDEETRNIEIYALGTMQSIFYSDTVPTSLSSNNDVWIGG